MMDMQETLRGYGVQEERIRLEVFETGALPVN